MLFLLVQELSLLMVRNLMLSAQMYLICLTTDPSFWTGQLFSPLLVLLPLCWYMAAVLPLMLHCIDITELTSPVLIV